MSANDIVQLEIIVYLQHKLSLENKKGNGGTPKARAYRRRLRKEGHYGGTKG